MPEWLRWQLGSTLPSLGVVVGGLLGALALGALLPIDYGLRFVIAFLAVWGTMVWLVVRRAPSEESLPAVGR